MSDKGSSTVSLTCISPSREGAGAKHPGRDLGGAVEGLANLVGQDPNSHISENLGADPVVLGQAPARHGGP